MTASSQADAGVFDPARKTHATLRAVAGTVVAGIAVKAVLAVVFGLSVMVEVSNTPEWAPATGTPVTAVRAASTPAARQPGEPLHQGSTTAF